MDQIELNAKLITKIGVLEEKVLKIEKYLSQQPIPLERRINESVGADNDSIAEAKDFLTTVFTTMYEKAQNYTSIIIGLGYAGFFALWDRFQNTFNSFDKIFSILMFTLSLSFFILWEITGMIFRVFQTKMNDKLFKGITPDNLQDRFKEYEKATCNQGFALNIIWSYFILPITVIPGLIGAYILLSVFTRLLFNSY